MDIIRRSGALILIAVIFQNLSDIVRNVAGTAFQHHIQVPGTSHAILSGRDGSHLVQNGVRPALRNQDVVGHNCLVILPPAAEGKGLGGGMAVHVKGDGEPGADLRLHPQQLQHVGVGSGLVGALLGQTALHRVAVHPVGFIGVGVADLHVGFVERHLRGHSDKPPHSPLVDEGVILQIVKLFLR